jgi:FecR protein
MGICLAYLALLEEDRGMKHSIYRVILIVVSGLLLCSFGFAQDRGKPSYTADKYMISAKAGGVNFIEGQVNVTRKEGHSGILLNRDELAVGDRVSTGVDGRVELLLNPGSYVRLGPNSEFEFKTTSLDDLQVRLYRGSAIFEVFAANEFRVTVGTPKGAASIVESGVYRVDLQPDGNGTIAVYSGKAIIGDVNLTVVKKGRVASIARTNVAVKKFDRGKTDGLAEWSKSRAKELAAMTASLKNANIRNSLISSFNSGRWNMFNSFGLWIWDPFGNRCLFLPFGWGWYSPYGFPFGGTTIKSFNLPPRIIRLPPPSAAGSPAMSVKPGRNPNAEPPAPYKSIERNREPVRGIGDNGGFRNDNPGVRNDNPWVRNTQAPPSNVSPVKDVAPVRIKQIN